MLTSVVPLRLKIVDVDRLIEKTEQLVIEDNHKFCLEQKSKLIRNFLVLRFCSELLSIIEKNRNNKLLFLVNKNAKLDVLVEHFSFVYAVFLKLAKLLSINFFIDKILPNDLEKTILSESGEGKEVRARIYHIINKQKKLPNIEKLKIYLKKNNITTVNNIDNNFNIKLGLFIT